MSIGGRGVHRPPPVERTVSTTFVQGTVVGAAARLADCGSQNRKEFDHVAQHANDFSQ